jgi:hypothetical protein
MTRARDNAFNPFNNQYAGKNILINGAFDFWQRGTTFSNTGASNKYTADRWGAVRGGWAAGQKTERIDINKSELPISVNYGCRISRIQGNSNTSSYAMTQCLEESMVVALAGQTVTFSFYARKSSSYTGTAIILSLLTGTSQFGPGDGVPGLVNNEIYVNPSLSWVRYSITATVPVNARGLGVSINATCSGTAPENEYLEIAGAQLEVGSIPTTFSRAGGTIGQELSLCHRYFQQLETFSNYLNVTTNYLSAYTNSYTQNIPFKINMRTSPSLTFIDLNSNSLKVTGYLAGGPVHNLSPVVQASAGGLRMYVSGEYRYFEILSVYASSEV